MNDDGGGYFLLSKKFKINQSRCAMKIGTDSVLLGSWVKNTDDVNTVLDIGAGTGVFEPYGCPEIISRSHRCSRN